VLQESRYIQWNEEVRENRCKFGREIALDGPSARSPAALFRCKKC